MKQVIAMHGWGGDSRHWEEWHNHFESKGWCWKSIDRGYGSIPKKSFTWLEGDNSSPQMKVVIAHSLGPHLISPEILNSASHVVLLGSFSTFLGGGKDLKSIEIAVKKMHQLLGTSKEKEMLSNFLEKAHGPKPNNISRPGPLTSELSVKGRERLKYDLELLINTHGLPSGFSKNSKVLVVEALKDEIVSNSAKASLMQDLLKSLLNPPTKWEIENSGHALLLPELINHVYKWLESTK